jgi:Rubisco Assembly chaperone C-terminal domain/Rubisco accumulation factor 1 alpha helical domain/Rubisco accumulation factor 1 helix turn helix domain
MMPTEEPLHDDAATQLLQTLRRKEGNWVGWGQACQQLQKAGFSPQKIFAETGFEPILQNQIIVAAQVYGTLESSDVSPDVLSRFERTGSDSLYELRVLTQSDRVTTAALLVEKGLDSEAARDVVKAVKDFSRLSRKPAEFPDYPHDAVAYFYWNLAKQQADLQARSRLIAQALRFAKSESARQQIERLLTDFSVTKRQAAPRLPFYRLESVTDQPRILPVAGRLPLTAADLQAVPLVESEGIFQLVKFSGGQGAWTALPSWQVVLTAADPVMILADRSQLPSDESEVPEELLLLVDRADREWDEDSYFLVEQAGQIGVDWFEEAPEQPLLGKVTLVLRPKRVLDEDFNKELWQVEE